MAIQLPTYQGEKVKNITFRSVKDEIRLAAEHFFQPVVAVVAVSKLLLKAFHTKKTTEEKTTEEGRAAKVNCAPK